MYCLSAYFENTILKVSIKNLYYTLLNGYIELFRRNLIKARDGSLRWLDHLDRVVIDYNSTVHSAIGIDPESVLLKVMVDVHQQALVDYASMVGKNSEVVNEGIVSSFEVGDVVRKLNKSIFRDGYWLNEVYKVVAILPYLRVSIKLIHEDGKPTGRKNPISVYKLTRS